MNILILKLITIITILIISLRNYILFEFNHIVHYRVLINNIFTKQR